MCYYQMRVKNVQYLGWMAFSWHSGVCSDIVDRVSNNIVCTLASANYIKHGGVSKAKLYYGGAYVSVKVLFFKIEF
jgi:hypothetical protein